MAVETKKKASKKKTSKAKDKVTDVIVTVAHEVENMTKDAAFEAAATLEDDIEFSYFRLGGILARIHTEQWYTEEGFEKFPEFVESRFGIKRSKAFHLIGIYNGLLESGVPWAEVKDVGWSKLKELVNVMTKKNVKGWVKRAKDMTVMQLIAYIKDQNAGDGTKGSESDAKKISSMTFKVHDDQKELINQALDKAKTETGSEFPAVALEAISMDYLAGPSKPAAEVKADKDAKPEKPTKAVLKDYMENFTWEEVLGVFEEIWPDVDLMVESE